MRPDPAHPSLSLGKLGGMASRLARAIVLSVGFAGCRHEVGTGLSDLSAKCLEEHPGDVRCCPIGTHIDHGTCCDDGFHAVSDFEHEDWRICVPDENPAGAEQDAGADAP
jgi:hypothetical protein